MKKITLCAAALCTAAVGNAQSLNLDMSPVSSSLRSVAPDVVNIVCFVFLVIAIAVVAMKYHEEREKFIGGFIASVIITGIIWGVARIAINAFL